MAAMAVTIYLTVAALSVFGWGLLMERVHTRYLALTAVLALPAWRWCWRRWRSIRSLTAAAFSVVFGSALGVWTVVSRMMFANYFGRRSFGTIRGFAAPIMAGVSMVGPILAGIVKDITGSYDLSFTIFAGVFGVAFVAFALAKPVVKQA